MMKLTFFKDRHIARDAGEAFEQKLKYIKKSLKQKIAVYEPLDFDTAFNEFVDTTRADDYRLIKELPGTQPLEDYLDNLLKDFLVEKTYRRFLFEEDDLIEKFVVDIVKNNAIPMDLCRDIAVFVRDKLEDKDKLANVKKNFKEKSKLKTYFYAMVRNAVMDYERKYNARVDLHDSFELDKIKSPAPSPHLLPEEKEIRERVNRLDPLSKIAFKMVYYENITNYNAIARTLNTSRHKAKKIVETALDKVLKGVV